MQRRVWTLETNTRRLKGVTTADVGTTIRVRVFARTIDGVGESADSVQTSVVAP